MLEDTTFQDFLTGFESAVWKSERKFVPDQATKILLFQWCGVNGSLEVFFAVVPNPFLLLRCELQIDNYELSQIENIARL